MNMDSFSKEVCLDCDKFWLYDEESNTSTDKIPNNCCRWLCNDGGCPKHLEITFEVPKLVQVLNYENSN